MRTQIHIDSSNREAYSSSISNFTKKWSSQLKKIANITLVQAQLPNAWYTIRTGVNDTLDITQSAVTNSCTVAEGNYSATSLASALETAINATSFSSFTVSFDSSTLKITITHATTNFDIETTSTMTNIIGFPLTTQKTGASTYTSDNLVNINGGEYIFIRSNTLSSGVNFRPYENGDETNVLYKIPVNVSSGSVVFYEPQFPITYYYSSPRNIHEVDFKLTFQDGEEVPMNGINWSITLEVEVVDM